MASVNKVTVMGNVGKDPELRHLPNGGAVCTISIATSRRWKDKNSGEMQEETEWHRVTFFERLAEIAGEYLKKGKPVYIEGRLKTRKYADKEGVERYVTEIMASEMQLLGGRDDAPQGGAAPQQRQQAPQQSSSSQSRAPAPQPQRQPQRQAQPQSNTGFDDMDSDIPF